MNDPMYLPTSAAVVAWQWDGTEQTLKTLRIVARFARYEVHTNVSDQLIISPMDDQRGAYTPQAVGTWIIVAPANGPFLFENDDNFKLKYVKFE